MDIKLSEMFSTTGGILFYGGIIGGGVSLLLLSIFVPIFSAAKKKMNKKIDKEFDKE